MIGIFCAYHRHLTTRVFAFTILDKLNGIALSFLVYTVKVSFTILLRNLASISDGAGATSRMDHNAAIIGKFTLSLSLTYRFHVSQ